MLPGAIHAIVLLLLQQVLVHLVNSAHPTINTRNIWSHPQVCLFVNNGHLSAQSKQKCTLQTRCSTLLIHLVREV